MPKLDDKSEWWLTSAAYVRAVLPPRPEDSHKGTFGSVLSIAGSLGMSGASVLAAKSALRAGAGLSLLATPRSLVAQLPAQEVIYHPLSETASGGISIAAQAELDVHMDRSAALILGPGIGSHVETIEFVQQFLKKIKKPCVVDADALNAISQNSSCWPGESDHFVLTPHPKEASRLIGLSSDEIQSNRIAAAQKAAARFNCTVVLKGAHTVIAGADQRVYINPTGNSAMATAGAGDVLSGVIGGLLAQGVKPFDAAVAGAYLHGAAGDLAAQEIAMAGTIAGDIMTYVPVAMTKLRSGEWRGSNLELQLIGPRH